MTEFCAKPSIIFALLDEISRHRALAPHETDMLEAILAIDQDHFRWTERLETELVAASTYPGGIIKFARRHGLNKRAVHQKLFRIRRRESRKPDSTAHKG